MVINDDNDGPFQHAVFHGFGGVLSVIDVYTSTLTKLLQNSFEEFGLKKKDLNGKNQFGKTSFFVLRCNVCA